MDFLLSREVCECAFAIATGSVGSAVERDAGGDDDVGGHRLSRACIHSCPVLSCPLTVLLIETIHLNNVKVDETTAVKGGSRQVGRIRVGVGVGVDGEENVDDETDDEPTTRRCRIYRGASWGGDVGGDDVDVDADG